MDEEVVEISSLHITVEKPNSWIWWEMVERDYSKTIEKKTDIEKRANFFTGVMKKL